MLIGDSGVGKTCLLVRFKDGAFLSGSFISTVGIDFRVSNVLCFSVIVRHKGTKKRASTRCILLLLLLFSQTFLVIILLCFAL